MPRSITVAVAGATGRQGGAVTRLLLHRGHHVRALTRRAESAAASTLRALGADISEADLEDGAAVRQALDGADALFLVVTPFGAGVEAEVRQACQAAKAAKEAGVRHLVYSSVASANQKTGIPHFDSKREVEKYIAKLDIPYTIVGPAFFAENLIDPSFANGLSAGVLSMPLPPSRPLHVVGLQDIAGFVRLVLERPGEFQGRRIDIASDCVTGLEMAKTLSEVSQREVTYRQGSLDAVRAASEDLALMWQWLDQVGYSTDVDVLLRSYPEVGWHDFGSWARTQDWDALLGSRPEQHAE